MGHKRRGHGEEAGASGAASLLRVVRVAGRQGAHIATDLALRKSHGVSLRVLVPGWETVTEEVWGGWRMSYC